KPNLALVVEAAACTKVGVPGVIAQTGAATASVQTMVATAPAMAASRKPPPPCLVAAGSVREVATAESYAAREGSGQRRRMHRGQRGSIRAGIPWANLTAIRDIRSVVDAKGPMRR